MRKKTLGALLAVAALASAGPFAEAATPLATSLEQALLAGDWAAVARKSGSPGIGDDPVSSMIRAHALLALNRNDQSVCIFAAASDAATQKAWDGWTSHFLSRHSDKAVAYYLRGDALARLGSWAPAMERFTQGLQRNASDPLLLNARGVSHAIAGRWNAATVDLDAITTDASSSGLADAWANKGVVALMQRQSASLAAERFDRALRLAPAFGLASAGLATARMALRQPDAAKAAADKAARSAGCVPKLVGNALRHALDDYDAREARLLADLDPRDIGTTLERRFDAVQRGDVGALNGIARIAGQHPEMAPAIRSRVDQITSSNPELGARIRDKIDSGRDWTSANGGAHALLNAFKGLQSTLGAAVGRSAGTSWDKTTVTGKTDVTWSAADYAKHQINKTSADHAGWESLGPRTTHPGVWPEGRTGGASSNSAQARWEVSDGPVIAEFGLLYPRNHNGR